MALSFPLLVLEIKLANFILHTGAVERTLVPPFWPDCAMLSYTGYKRWIKRSILSVLAIASSTPKAGTSKSKSIFLTVLSKVGIGSIRP